MTDYQELKRLAEAAKHPEHDESEAWYPPEFTGEIYYPKNARFISAASPDVVLSMIAEIEQVKGLLMGALNQRDTLRTQNQALQDDKEVLLSHVDTFMRVSNDPAIYNLAKVVIERFAKAEGGL